MITDVAAAVTPEGSSTPAGNPDDDFFSSWDKPSIKRPSNPPSRTGTPSSGGRSSPFLTPGPNGNGSRPKSPLSSTEKSNASSPPVAVRTATAVRKGPAAAGKKTSVLGAKKGPKLGAKKVVGADAIDFDEAERKAKEEAERIAKLGYDPESERAEEEAATKGKSASSIVSPTPISPRTSFGATRSHERSASEVERLGMGMGRLGFGQVGKPKAPAPKKLGFGAVGHANSAVDGTCNLLIHPLFLCFNY